MLDHNVKHKYLPYLYEPQSYRYLTSIAITALKTDILRTCVLNE